MPGTPQSVALSAFKILHLAHGASGSHLRNYCPINGVKKMPVFYHIGEHQIALPEVTATPRMHEHNKGGTLRAGGNYRCPSLAPWCQSVMGSWNQSWAPTVQHVDALSRVPIHFHFASFRSWLALSLCFYLVSSGWKHMSAEIHRSWPLTYNKSEQKR